MPSSSQNEISRNRIMHVALTGSSSLGSGFGSSNPTPFGANKPTFGSSTTSGGGLFGSTTATTGNAGFGGFGTNNATSGPPFGASTTTTTNGGLFGNAAKSGFGAGAANNTSLFGGGSSSSTNPFGGNNNQTGSVFGTPQSTALAIGTAAADCQGTGSTPFQAWTEKDTPGGTMTNHFQSISFMPPYKNFSFEVRGVTVLVRNPIC